jgi:apolipoprotein N-acyltransferase
MGRVSVANSKSASRAVTDGPPRAGDGHALWAGALASGALLLISDHVFEATALQLVAFVPFLAAMRRCERGIHAAIAGGLLGVARLAPLVRALGAVPLLGRVAIPLYLAMLYASFGVICFAARRFVSPTLQPLAIAAAFAAIELVDASLPMWGTALSLAAAWSSRPSAIRFIAFTGTAGLAFFVLAAQSLALSLVVERKRARLGALLLLLLACLFACVSLVKSPSGASTSLRVAAVGWAGAPGEGRAHAELLVSDAAAKGATLVVLPEAAFMILSEEREGVNREMGDLARRHAVHLAVGIVDRGRRENLLVLFGPSGAIEGQYVKTHLVPLAEDVRAGDGELMLANIGGVKVGAMICQDDNFSDLTRRYARAGGQVVVLPTFEMSAAMAALHARNSLLRPIEGGFAIVRAATNGTSMIVSNEGQILSSVDHLAAGPAAIVADLRVP